jgi:exodeoxyribonuclease-3
LEQVEDMDFEGRTIRVDFDESGMSLYLPSGTNSARLGYKFLFMDDFQNYITDLKKEIPNLVICGDYNICHEAIDIHNPVQSKKVSGFFEEKTWFDGFLNGFIDSFRFLNKNRITILGGLFAFLLQGQVIRGGESTIV